MSDQDITLTSGSRIHITTASFANANALVKALLKAAEGMPLDESLLRKDVSILKDTVIRAATSPEVERALYACMERCSYNDIKLIPSNFDNPGTMDDFRRDYFEVCWKVVEVNCGPFFDKAFSTLKARLANVAGSQKSA